MKVVRRGVFETNSSSTHSISIVAKEDYDKWRSGAVYKNGDSFYTREEAILELQKDKYFIKYNPNFDFSNEEETDEMLEEYEYITYENWGNDYETFYDSYKTKNGDEVVAFGYFGYDG